MNDKELQTLFINNYSEDLYDEIAECCDGFGSFEFMQKLIIENCISKQKLKKVLENIREKLGKEHTGIRLFETLVKEELNLND